MNLQRRTLLQLILSPLLASAFPGAVPAQSGSRPTFLLLDDLGRDLDVPHLSAVLQPFLSASIPVALVLRPSLAGDEAATEADAYLARLLRDRPDLVEPIVAVNGLGRMQPYFQRRAVSDAFARLSRLLGEPAEGRAVLPAPVSVATDGWPGASYDALRALGIRNVVELDAAARATSAACFGSTICLSGTSRIGLADAQAPDVEMAEALAGPDWLQVVVSLAGLAAIDSGEVWARVERMVDEIVRVAQAGQRFTSLPRTQLDWLDADKPRQLALLVTAPPSAARTILEAGLRARNIPYSVLASDNADAPGACLPLEGMPEGTLLAWAEAKAGTPVCALAATAEGGLTQAAVASLDLILTADPWPVFDERGLLRRAASPFSLSPDEPAGPRDRIIELGADALDTEVSAWRALKRIVDIKAQPATALTDLPGFIRATVSTDPVYDLMRATLREPADARPGDADAVQLMADARRAWSYFETFTDKTTGLCVGTADLQETETYLQKELTMWDLGSQIAATIAAHELGLIGDGDFIGRADPILAALSVSSRRGLPGLRIASASGRWLSADFNACDTGRLLSTLWDLDAHPLVAGRARAVVAGWDFASVLQDGRLKSIDGGALRDDFLSHCTHYTARALRRWGHPAISPYEVGAGQSQADWRMRLLYEAGKIGPYGAEPLLLEAVEMGLSVPSRFLAEVLYGAQRRASSDTGVLHCVSEAPIDRRPWFTYQGLDVTSVEAAWAVQGPDDEPTRSNVAFRRDMFLINAKGAYLWNAVHPSALSLAFVQQVRETGAEVPGFPPGIFARTGETMPSYRDVNTNGIILEAIAYIMRGRSLRGGSGPSPRP